MNLGLASKIEMDKQGRVLFPDKILKRSGIGKEVTLVGNRDHLELWDRSQWETERERLSARREEIALRIRQARQQQPPT